MFFRVFLEVLVTGHMPGLCENVRTVGLGGWGQAGIGDQPPENVWEPSGLATSLAPGSLEKHHDAP